MKYSFSGSSYNINKESNQIKKFNSNNTYVQIILIMNKISYQLKPKKHISIKHQYIYLYDEVSSLIKRLYIQISRRPSTLFSGIIQPLLWLFLFGALFQNAPVGLFTQSMPYNRFLSPGIIVFTAFTGSINAGLPLMFDREFGFLNRLLVSPLVSRDSILASSMFFITTLTILQTSIMIICSCIMFTNAYTIHELIYILLIILLISCSIASISICLAFILPGHIEYLACILIINLPMLFSSTALAPLSFMPHWLQIIASINPLTYAIESIRYILENNRLYQNSDLIHTTWLHLGFYENLCLLLLFNILSFTVTKNVISYKFE